MKTAIAEVNFELPQSDCIPEEFTQYIHAEWIDRVPIRVNAIFQDGHLEIHHDYKESLRVVIPWNVDGLGVFFLKTVSLPRRERPYDLLLELARGTVGRLVDQAENWATNGVSLSEEMVQELSAIKTLLRDATYSDGDERNKNATQAISSSIPLMNQIGDCFARFVFDLRIQEKQPNQALLGGLFESNDDEIQSSFLEAFNSAMIPIPLGVVFNSGDKDEIARKTNDSRKIVENVTRQLHRRGVTTCTEPFLRFSNLPKTDFQSIEDAAKKLTSITSKSLDLGSGSCKLFYPISEIGCSDEGMWNEQEQIHLVHQVVTKMKTLQPKVPVIVGLNQPFGEAKILRQDRQPPLQIADSLIRMETPIAAFCLEINLGYYPTGSWTRDLFAFNDLLDTWAQIDFPLLIELRIPGGVQSVDHEFGDFQVTAGVDSQASWVKHLITLAVAKQNVAGVFYGTLLDHPDDDYFGSGLVTHSGLEKPAFKEIKKLRQQFG